MTSDWTEVLDALEAHLDARDAVLATSRPGSDTTGALPDPAGAPLDLPQRMGTPTESQRSRARALALRIEEQLVALGTLLGTVHGELDRVTSQRSPQAPPSVARPAASRLDQHA